MQVDYATRSQSRTFVSSAYVALLANSCVTLLHFAMHELYGIQGLIEASVNCFYEASDANKRIKSIESEFVTNSLDTIFRCFLSNGHARSYQLQFNDFMHFNCLATGGTAL